MKSILDPKFRYTNAVSTDLRKTFARVRREQQQQQQENDAARAEQRRRAFIDQPDKQHTRNVTAMPRSRKVKT